MDSNEHVVTSINKTIKKIKESPKDSRVDLIVLLLELLENELNLEDLQKARKMCLIKIREQLNQIFEFFDSTIN